MSKMPPLQVVVLTMPEICEALATGLPDRAANPGE